ncbi:MAG TPA: hypothetical protein VFL91_27215 [Thermomicrobiales bacterium]|nr:hypothetical protein [Thermomicrobiales bacterium]
MNGYRCRLCGAAHATIGALVAHVAAHPESALAPRPPRFGFEPAREERASAPPPPEAHPCCAHTRLEARLARRAVRENLRAEKRHRRGARQRRDLRRRAYHKHRED